MEGAAAVSGTALTVAGAAWADASVVAASLAMEAADGAVGKQQLERLTGEGAGCLAAVGGASA